MEEIRKKRLVAVGSSELVEVRGGASALVGVFRAGKLILEMMKYADSFAEGFWMGWNKEKLSER